MEDRARPRLVSLEPRPKGAKGSFRARDRSGRRYTVVLATRGRPLPHHRALAFFRLASFLETTIVPPTYAQPLAVRELAELLATQAEALDFVRQEASVRNDGTVMALLQREQPGRVRSLGAIPEQDEWMRLAGSTEPLPKSQRALIQGYVELLVLDYLAGNARRRDVLIDEAERRLFAVDNATAFPGFVAPEALDGVLDKLRKVARFPRALRPRLRALRTDTAAELFASGRYGDWLLHRRQLLDLAERRATMLSLLEARVAQYGEPVALGLGE